jgi:hypothetical protein
MLFKEIPEEFIKELEERGYRRISGHYKNEDFGYWKSFHISKDEFNDDVIGYQIALLFYVFNKYPQYDGEFPVHVSLNMLSGDGGDNKYSRVDLTITDKNITIDEFEVLADKVYNVVNDL